MLCPMRRAHRRLPLLLLFGSTACHSWRVETISPAQVISLRQPNKVRLLTRDGTRMELHQPSVAGYVLSGHEKHTVGTRAIPFADIRSLETLQADGTKTGILVGSLAAVAAGLAVIANELNNALCCD
jgi:hypothetical protein